MDENRAGRKTPLVISVHGPPGVGKTLTHTLAARALYGLDGAGRAAQRNFWSGWGLKIPRLQASQECPGRGCAGYKVLYGMDFMELERDQQRQALRDAIVDHVKAFHESFVVVEEYDKLDCDTRSMLRQLVQHPELANVSMGRSIFLLESNLGMFELQAMLQEAGGRAKVTAEGVHHKLKDLIFDHWRMKSCESFYDTLKNTNLVDLFLPYFALEKEHIRMLLEMRLREFAAMNQVFQLYWDNGVVDFLFSKIEFDGNYPVDGAKDVDASMRYVSRVIRQLRRDKELPSFDSGGYSIFKRRQQPPRVVLKSSRKDSALHATVER